MLPIKALFAKILAKLIELDGIRVSKTIAASGSSSLSFSDISGGLLILDGGSANYHGLYTVYHTSGTSIYGKAVMAPANTSITVTFSSGTATVSNGTTGTVFATYITAHGVTPTWS